MVKKNKLGGKKVRCSLKLSSKYREGFSTLTIGQSSCTYIIPHILSHVFLGD